MVAAAASAAASNAPAEASSSSKWSSRQAAEYLQRWGVEEAVQQAVNSAIKHKAADPVLHIADFLEEKGHEMEAFLAAQTAREALAAQGTRE